MRASHILIALAAVGGLLLVSERLVLIGAPGTGEAVEAPQHKLQALVEPIRGIMAAEDAASVAAFCGEFADVLERDGEAKLIADTGDLYERLRESSALMFQESGIEQRLPGLPAQINEIVSTWTGVLSPDGQVEVVDLDGDTDYRAKAIEAFRAIAWAVEQ